MTYWPQEITERMTVLAFDAPANHRAARRSLNNSHNNGQQVSFHHVMWPTRLAVTFSSVPTMA